MLVTFATDPPDITEPIAVPGVCGETVAVWAWGGHVVVETAEGPDLIVARLRGPGRAGTIARAAELWRQRSRGSIANEDEVVRWEAQQVWA